MPRFTGGEDRLPKDRRFAQPQLERAPLDGPETWMVNCCKDDPKMASLEEIRVREIPEILTGSYPRLRFHLLFRLLEPTGQETLDKNIRFLRDRMAHMKLDLAVERRTIAELPTDGSVIIWRRAPLSPLTR